MRAVKIKIEPFEFISILKLESAKELNEHGKIKIVGLIEDRNEQSYHEHLLDEAAVCVKIEAEDGEDDIFFQGIITALSIHTESRVHTLTIEAKTGSYLLDRTSHTRLFQDGALDYETVIRGLVREAGGDVLMADKYDEKIEKFIVQYKETDWAFSKRLANNLGTVLLPEFKNIGKLFHIASLKTGVAEQLLSNDFIFERLPAGDGGKSLLWHEQGMYRVCSREIHHLGEHVVFRGIRLIVGKIESWLEGGELYHRYLLYLLKTDLEILKYNNHIQGVAMKGNVQKVEGTKVQVSIHEDENKSLGNRWFEYATVYSTPDGTGWYCMPEEGDEVRLVFPDEDEAKAYVAGSVHLEGGNGRDNPDEKFWKNRWNKEIRFTPKTLVMTNNDGLSVELSDDQGITVTSNKGIYLNGGQEIKISAGACISVYGDKDVFIKQRSSHIRLKDKIDIVGGRINMN